MVYKAYKTKRKSQPKRSSKVKGSKRQLSKISKEVVNYNQPNLHAAYNEKGEWVRKIIPKQSESAKAT